MICGLVAIVCTVLFFLLITIPVAALCALAALVTGALGMRAARETGGGKGQAITGIVAGILSLVGLGLLAVGAAFLWDATGFQTNPFTDPEGFEAELRDRGLEVDEQGEVDFEEFQRRLEEDLEGR
jgi:hypothetical protein